MKTILIPSKYIVISTDLPQKSAMLLFARGDIGSGFLSSDTDNRIYDLCSNEGEAKHEMIIRRTRHTLIHGIFLGNNNKTRIKIHIAFRNFELLFLTFWYIFTLLLILSWLTIFLLRFSFSGSLPLENLIILFSIPGLFFFLPYLLSHIVMEVEARQSIDFLLSLYEGSRILNDFVDE